MPTLPEQIGLITEPINMSEKEFVKWFKGFVDGAHHFNITPKQWDEVKEKLSTVGKESTGHYYIDNNLWTTTVA